MFRAALSRCATLGVGPLLAAAAVGPLATATPAAASGGAKGMFKVVCDYSHSAPNDPIVFPNRPGASHLHDFTGNTTTDASSTLASLQRGRTTCNNVKDLSAYWAPALYQNGTRVEPKEMQVYYRASNRNAKVIRSIPLGLRMVAGNHDATKPQSTDIAGWTCIDNPPNFQSTMPTFSPGQKLRNRIRFPECWDGKHLDSADHKSHLAYLVNGSCPSNHPVAIPRVDIEVHYGNIAGGASRVTLASGSWTTLHADFWNVWNPATLQGFVTQCLVNTQICNVV